MRSGGTHPVPAQALELVHDRGVVRHPHQAAVAVLGVVRERIGQRQSEPTDLGLRFPEILRNAGLTVERHVGGRIDHSPNNSSSYFSSKPNSPIFNVRQFSLTIR